MTADPGSSSVAVVGPGRMGAGIAQVFARADADVRLVDAKERPEGAERSALEEAAATIRSNLEFLAETGRFEGSVEGVLGNVERTRSVAGGLDGADWIFEALPEDPEVKSGFLRDAAPAVPADAVVATTTSSISLSTLSDAVPDSGRLLITHWLNPAFVVPLVEVARTDRTDDDAVSATVDLLESVGKEPVVCRDSPGFVGSRVQAAAMNEAVRAYQDGVAAPEDIDRALRSGVGFRMAAMGLLEFVDLGGVDVLYRVNEYLAGELGERFENPDSVAEKMAANDLGPSTGRGYYEYDDVDADELAREKYAAMLALRDAMEE